MTSKSRALIAAAAVASAFVATSSHAAFLNNWFFDYDGPTGAAGKTLVKQYLDFIGPSIVNTSTPNAGQFTFDEKGAILVNGHDGSSFPISVLANNQIAALFDLSGNGTLGGAVTYTSGTINVYYTPASADTFGTDTGTGTFGVNDTGSILIATFSPISGGGNIDVLGVPNGQQTITAAAQFMLPGFFFAPNGTDDLSDLVGGPTPLLFGFATTNASYTNNPDPVVVSELGDGSFTNCLPGQVADPTDPTNVCTGTTGEGEFAIGNNGQFRLLEVPEPGTLALLGISLLGLGIASRRKV